MNKPKNFNLLESILLINDDYFLLSLHLDRLGRSASYFNFKYDEQMIIKKLNTYKHNCHHNKIKVRLTLSKNGEITVSGEQLNEAKQEQKTVIIATEPIDKTDIFHYHKTTNRDIYIKHRNLITDNIFDVIMWNEAEEITECTIGNLIFEKGNIKYTPPVSSGLLAGTYRQHLLNEGQITERKIYLEEIHHYKQIYFINSVRLIIPIKILT